MLRPETLHVLRAHVLEDFRRLALAERQQQDGGAFDAAATGSWRVPHSSARHP